MDLYFYPVHNTCTMIELGSPYLTKSSTKDQFLARFDKYLKDKNLLPRHAKNYAIIYNCTCKDRYNHLTRIGFKEIGSYQGGHGRQVHILLFDCKKATKMTFWEWFRS